MEYFMETPSSKLQEIIRILVQCSDPLRIILFGSYANGTNKKDSDYDICVIKEPVIDLNSLEKKLFIDLHRTGEAVDLIVSSPERFLNSQEKKYSIFREIANKGKIVYERK